MSARFRILFCVLFCAACVNAAPIIYNVSVDTSTISGVMGSLDFNFNPGPLVTQAASLQILNFMSDGTLAGNCPCGTGDVAGQLPAALTFDNGAAFNDYFDGFSFGSTLSFQVSLYGPALSSPDGVSTSGSTFAFSMFSDAAGTMPALTTDTTDGFAFLVDVNLDGSTTVNNFSAQTTVTAAASGAPEPGSVILIGVGLLCLGVLRLRPPCLTYAAHVRGPSASSTPRNRLCTVNGFGSSAKPFCVMKRCSMSAS